eukprot:scaffold4141_cov63-Phaeocystis_antarctica.AAC.3
MLLQGLPQGLGGRRVDLRHRADGLAELGLALRVGQVDRVVRRPGAHERVDGGVVLEVVVVDPREDVEGHDGHGLVIPRVGAAGAEGGARLGRHGLGDGARRHVAAVVARHVRVELHQRDLAVVVLVDVVHDLLRRRLVHARALHGLHELFHVDRAVAVLVNVVEDLLAIRDGAHVRLLLARRLLQVLDDRVEREGAKAEAVRLDQHLARLGGLGVGLLAGELGDEASGVLGQRLEVHVQVGELGLLRLVLLVRPEGRGGGDVELEAALEAHPQPLGRALADRVALLLLGDRDTHLGALGLGRLLRQELAVQVDRHRAGGGRIVGRHANLGNEGLLVVNLEHDALEPLRLVRRDITGRISVQERRGQELVVVAAHLPVEETGEARLWLNVKLDPLVTLMEDGIPTDRDLLVVVDLTVAARLSLRELDLLRANVARAGARRHQALGGGTRIGVAALLKSVGAAVGVRIPQHRVEFCGERVQ